MKKILLFMTILAGVNYASAQTKNLYAATDDVFGYSYDAAGTTQFMTLEKVTTTNACGTANEIKVNYASPGNGSYWAGQGAYNVDGWGSNIIDFSLYTDIEFKVKYTGTDPLNELKLILEDSNATPVQSTAISVAGTEAASCISKKISLASIKGAIDYKKVKQIIINIGNFQWNATKAIEGSGSGTFYIDEIKLTGGPLGVEDFVLNSSVSVSPNPSNGTYNINSAAGNVKTVSVTDIAGNIVFEGKESTIDLSNVAQGVYFAKIVTDNNTVKTQKLIKK